MSKIKVLIPLDGSEKSMHSLDWIKKYFGKDSLEVTLLNVVKVVYTSEVEAVAVQSEFEIAEKNGQRILDAGESRLEGYEIIKTLRHGSISDSILKESVDGCYDMIVMTKSSVKGLSRIIGSVANKIVRDSQVAVIVVPE